MKYLILLTAFIVMVLADSWLISRGKKDLSVEMDAVAILLVVSITGAMDDAVGFFARMNVWFSDVYMASAPFLFFDIVLNWLRGKPWHYLNNTKKWDRFLRDYNPWFLLAVRVVVCGLLIWWAL